MEVWSPVHRKGVPNSHLQLFLAIATTFKHLVHYVKFNFYSLNNKMWQWLSLSSLGGVGHDVDKTTFNDGTGNF